MDHGNASPDDTLEAFSHYKLAPVADRIWQDVLILADTEDHFIPFHQVADFEKSLVNARSVTTRIFDRLSGGANTVSAAPLRGLMRPSSTGCGRGFPCRLKRICGVELTQPRYWPRIWNWQSNRDVLINSELFGG